MVGWGDTALPAQRILALDKNTGEPRWFTHTNPKPEDTVFSTPTFTVLDGQAEMIVGSADGAVWAFQPRTGKAMWNFRMSPRGLNLSPNVVGDKVYMAQGEENLDRKSAGSLVCFKADGTDDTTDNKRNLADDERFGQQIVATGSRWPRLLRRRFGQFVYRRRRNRQTHRQQIGKTDRHHCAFQPALRRRQDLSLLHHRVARAAADQGRREVLGQNAVAGAATK